MKGPFTAGADAEERFRTLARSENEFGVDAFGFNLEFALAAAAPFIWLYRHYHRVESRRP